ncbi:hypothetical protein EV384_2107 [Micromonospora kangleipakensis]|uniref:PknH-like protein n=1 Tax=Micromonospora kangleipakensis TaxID=1077942 RepID=A0A4Q8B894_9ACTN|nr:hypothetical protein [Micromonospora kangleipakensis]RZU73688.1 hypothetical protein EV384_2107 [Micromonospora kangleipakensis]
MMRRTPLLLLSLLACAALAACGTSEADEAAAWSVPAVPSAKPSPTTPSPRPAPASAAEIRRQVKAAMVDLAGLRPETADISKEDTEGYKLAHPCRDTLPTDRKRTGYRGREWGADSDIWIRQYVVGYLKVPGRTLIAELRSALKGCKKYREPDGRTTTVLPMATPLAGAGSETVAWCEKLVGDNGTGYLCTALTARGNYVMEINAGEAADHRKSEALLRTVHPEALAAFAKAT